MSNNKPLHLQYDVWYTEMNATVPTQTECSPYPPIGVAAQRRWSSASPQFGISTTPPSLTDATHTHSLSSTDTHKHVCLITVCRKVWHNERPATAAHWYYYHHVISNFPEICKWSSSIIDTEREREGATPPVIDRERWDNLGIFDNDIWNNATWWYYKLNKQLLCLCVYSPIIIIIICLWERGRETNRSVNTVHWPPDSPYHYLQPVSTTKTPLPPHSRSCHQASFVPVDKWKRRFYCSEL